MKLSEIQKLLGAEQLTPHIHDDLDLQYCYSCDLMSDVLAYVKNNVLLITGLVHPQVIRTAEMLDLNAIVFVRGKKPGQEIIDLATSKDISLLSSNHSLYTASGILYQHGILGEETTHETSL